MVTLPKLLGVLGHPCTEFKVRPIACICVLMVVTACANTGPSNSSSNDETGAVSGRKLVDVSSDIQEFRGVRMPKVLERMDSPDRSDWEWVRDHVTPEPEPPYDEEAQEVNYAWPPEDPSNLTEKQKAWRSYVAWPRHIRELLQKKGWDSEENRTRLARLGRMYELVYEFQNAPEYGSRIREQEHWRQFAETMLGYGEDGENLLIGTMVVALTNPVEANVLNAQSILIQIGEPAIDPLLTALWTGFNQMAIKDDGSIRVTTNTRYYTYILDALYAIGPRALPRAIYELENGPVELGAWRFRKNFIELLGRFGDPSALRALESELKRIKIKEIDWAEYNRSGKIIEDREATDQAQFVYEEYILAAAGNITDAAALPLIIEIWKRDDFHEEAAISAIYRITARSVRSMAEAERLSAKLNAETKDDKGADGTD